MNSINVATMFIIIAIISLLILRLFSKQLIFFEKIVILSILTFIFTLVFYNLKEITKIINSKNIYNFIAILFAFFGSIIWFVGEYLTYSGREKHSLLDPIGAFFSSFSALITLIIFLDRE